MRRSILAIAVVITLGGASAAQAEEESAPTVAQANRAIRHVWHGFSLHREWCRRGGTATRCKYRIRVHECVDISGQHETCDVTYLQEVNTVRWKGERLAVRYDSGVVAVVVPR